MAENGRAQLTPRQRKQQLRDSARARAEHVKQGAKDMGAANFGDTSIDANFVDRTYNKVRDNATQWRDDWHRLLQEREHLNIAAEDDRNKKDNERRKYNKLLKEWREDGVATMHVVWAYHAEMVIYYRNKYHYTFRVAKPTAWTSIPELQLAAAARRKMETAKKIYNLTDMMWALRKDFIDILKIKYQVTAPNDV